MANFLLKIKLIIWKNLIIRKRRWLFTIFEIVVPVLLYVLLASLKTLIPDFERQYVNETEYYEVRYPNATNSQRINLFFTPNYTTTNNIMDEVTNSELFMLNEYRGFDSEESMLAYISFLKSNHTDYFSIMGVVFNNMPQKELPKKLDYRIKTNMYNVDSLFFPDSIYANTAYFSSGFVYLQEAIDKAFIKLQAPTKKQEFVLTFQQMPTPPHWQAQNLNDIFSLVLPLFTVFAFMLVFVNVIQRVLEEKSSGIKELMKMMGLESWMLWLGWYLHSMFAILLSITAITILLKVSLKEGISAFIEFSDGFLLWIFFFLYCTSGICFCFMCTTFFKKPMLGSSVGTVLWMLTIIPVLIIIKNDDVNSLTFVRNFILIFPNSCLAYGFKTISEYETREIGMQWSNLYSTPNAYIPYQRLGVIFLMLVIDSLIFLLITWYVDNIHPGEYGVARSWKFPFQKSYWLSNIDTSENTSDDYVDSRDEVEAPPPDVNIGIQIRNLHKKFKGKTAVNGLNLDVYSNQITVLLGHNGAGKTTTMNIVTGMISANDGSVFVGGYNVQNQLNQVRESLGLCPQHNVHFPDLTVQEHFEFFAMLRGVDSKTATQDSKEQLIKLGLAEKSSSRASQLSGGQRRRLSLGMALAGHSRVLLLDEPTTGMDPEARRHIWDLLLAMRGHQTILITTHYMEEADILGDRIAIMHSGQLMCYGTPLFLKKHYGTGYVLSILVAQSWDINTITDAIKMFVSNAEVKNISVDSIKFELPTNDTSALTKLFLHLESKKVDLGIASFGVSITTMDDVFLKVGKLADEVDKENCKNSETTSETVLLQDNFTDESQKIYNSGFSLLIQQFSALFMKRIQYVMHKWIMFLIGILIPVAIELLIVTSNKLTDNSGQNITRELTLSAYSQAHTFYSNVPETKNLAMFYSKIVQQQDSKAENVPQVSNAIVNVGLDNMDKYHNTLITAAELNFTDNKMILNAMYGNLAVHGPAISLNLITNAVLKYFMGDNDYSISTTNNPLPDYYVHFGGDSDNQSWMFNYPFGLTLFIGMLLGFHIAERLSGAKHLQIMSGVSRFLYWINNYIFDYLIFLFVLVISVIIIVIFKSPLSHLYALQAFTVLTVLYGLAMLPFSYFFQYRPTAGSIVTFLIWANIIFGMVLPTVIMVWEFVPEEKKALREALTYIYLLFPQFSIAYGLFKIIKRTGTISTWDSMTKEQKDSACQHPFSSYPCCVPKSQKCLDIYNYYKGDDSISPILLLLVAQIFLYFALFLFVDYGFARKLFDKTMDVIRNRSPQIEDSNLDSDVVEERKRVATQINDSSRMSAQQNRNDVLLVSNLRKWFSNFHAVRGLNFGVKTSECFGLLGINGAGKTTTFKMLTGEIFPSTGAANILDFSLKDNKSTYLKQIGYCPQFDAFNFQLTTRQMLTTFAHLRGIPYEDVNKQVNKWLHKFDIMKYENIQCEKLSGGNKRKLSTAMALIGDPPLIMLDEPTSGVDPVARRNLWGILAVLRKSGQAIVLTSHSMDECEALCDRLAIMVDGQMKCIGDIQYLKNKFGQGFSVMVKLRYVTTVASGDSISFDVQIHELKKVIQEKFICTLKDEHKGMLLYHVADTNLTLGAIFEFMDSLKHTREIVEDFTVSDTSLEQVFISFAKEKYAIDKNNTTSRDNVV